MKKFEFSLERMRDYKEQLLDKEKGALKALQDRKHQLEDRLDRMQRFRQEKNRELVERQRRGISKQEMDVYRLYIDNARLQIRQLEADLRVAESEVDQQMEVVVHASQEVSGLNRLEDKQVKAYRKAEAKEQERLLSELLIGGQFRPRKL